MYSIDLFQSTIYPLLLISSLTLRVWRIEIHQTERDVTFFSLVGRIRQKFAAFEISDSIYLFLHCTLYVRHMFFYSVGFKLDCPLSY